MDIDPAEVVIGVERMLEQRGTPATRDGPPDAELLRHLGKRLQTPRTPVWWVPAARTALVITTVERLSIQDVRDLWAVLQAAQRRTGASLGLELVTRHPLSASGVPEVGECVHSITWLAVLLCPTRHRLVPAHTVLRGAAAQSECPWPAARLPRLLRTDPVARYLGMRPGDVVRIDRRADDPARSHPYWRVVC